MTSDPPGTPWMFRGLDNRNARQPVPPVVWLLVGAAVLFLGILAIQSSVHNERWLTAHGIHTDARFVSVDCGSQPTSRFSAGTCSPYGTFSFRTDSGKQVSTRMYLPGRRNFRIGERVPIEYNPHNPADARLADGSATSASGGIVLGIGLAVSGAGFALAGLLKTLRALGDRRLAHEPETPPESA